MVAGASGLLGANLVVAWQHRQPVLGVYYRHQIFFTAAKSVSADLSDFDAIEDLLQFYRPDWIINCAGLTNVDYCESHLDEAYAANVKVVLNLAAAARRTGAKLVHISTDAVFSGETGWYSESDSPGPLNRYAKSKLLGEEAAALELPDSLIIRTNIFGWNAREKMSLAEWVLSHLESGQAISGFADVIFNPILVNDLSEIILQMMGKGLTGIYHAASSEACSKYEFALRLADIFRLDRILVKHGSIENAELPALRPKNTSLQTRKITQALSITMPDLESGLRRFKELRDRGYVNQLKAMAGG